MKRQSILITVLVVVALGAGGWWLKTGYHPTRKSTTGNSSSLTNVNSAALPTTVKYQGQDGKNALELLKEKHQVMEADGFVTAIDDRSNSKVFFWMLYVNGKQSAVGAKDLKTQPTDQLEWRYEGLTSQ